MYAVAVNGSPRKGGNTEILLNHALEPLKKAGWETELVQVGGQKIRGCQACYKCFERKDGQCAMKNDVFNPVMEKLLRADALIFGSPTYFADVSAELKALLDRAGLVALANGRAFKGKIGAAVVAVRRGGATHVYDTINHMFLMSKMLVPGSTYWNMGFGHAEREAAKDAFALENMRHLGRAIDWLGKAVVPHMAEYPAA